MSAEADFPEVEPEREGPEGGEDAVDTETAEEEGTEQPGDAPPPVRKRRESFVEKFARTFKETWDQATVVINDSGQKIDTQMATEIAKLKKASPQMVRSYEAKLNMHRGPQQDLSQFLDESTWKKAVIKKKGGERLAIFVKPTPEGCIVPGVIIHEVTPDGPAHRSGLVMIGDQITKVNGHSIVGMKFDDIIALISGVSSACEVTLHLIQGAGIPKADVELAPGVHTRKEQTAALFNDPANHFQIQIKKRGGDPLGISITPTLLDAVVPGVFISQIVQGGPMSSQVQLGDQIIKVNGQSVVGMTYNQTLDLLAGVKQGSEISMELVRTKQVKQLTITKGPLTGFKLIDGAIFSVTRGGSAEANGLRPRQILMEIDGRNVYGLPDAADVQGMLSDPAVQLVSVIQSSLEEGEEGNKAEAEGEREEAEQEEGEEQAQDNPTTQTEAC